MSGSNDSGGRVGAPSVLYRSARTLVAGSLFLLFALWMLSLADTAAHQVAFPRLLLALLSLLLGLGFVLVVGLAWSYGVRVDPRAHRGNGRPG